MITLKSIVGIGNRRFNSNEYPWEIVATVLVDSKQWTKMRDKKQLSILYGVDISNLIYQINSNIPAYIPLVDANSRASKGLKTVKLTYFLKDIDKAKNLGFKILAGKYAYYTDSVKIY